MQCSFAVIAVALWIGAHKLYLNYQFGQPNPFSVQRRDRYVPDPSFPTSYAVTRDPLTGLVDGILKRPATDPIVIHVRASVRAMIKKSLRSRVSTATRTFLAMSSVGMTRRPSVCPYLLGNS